VKTPAEALSGQAADWNVFRRQMPIAQQWAYFDHAAVAPLSGPAQMALAQWVEDATNNGSENYPVWTGRVEHLRTSAADMSAGRKASWLNR